MTLDSDDSKAIQNIDTRALADENALPAQVVSRGLSQENARLWLRVTAHLHEKLGRPVQPKDYVTFGRGQSKDAKAIGALVFAVGQKEAAERYYQLVAAHYCRVVRVMVSEDRDPVRAIVHVTQGESSGYVPLETAATRPDFRAQVLAEAARDLRAFRAKYANLRSLIDSPEFSRAVEAIERAVESLGGES